MNKQMIITETFSKTTKYSEEPIYSMAFNGDIRIKIAQEMQ